MRGHVAHVGAPPSWIDTALEPRALPRPTAGGYSSRSWPGRVGYGVSRRSRRASAPTRLRTSVRGQPLRKASRKWRRMLGYFVALKEMFCTALGRTQPAGWYPRSRLVAATWRQWASPPRSRVGIRPWHRRT